MVMLYTTFFFFLLLGVFLASVQLYPHVRAYDQSASRCLECLCMLAGLSSQVFADEAARGTYLRVFVQGLCQFYDTLGLATDVADAASLPGDV